MTTASLVTMNKANLTLDGTGTLSINQIETFTVGTLSLSAGTETYTGLIDADGSSLEATGGASLSFPSLASYAGGVNYLSTVEASGSGSTLLFPKLATLTSDTTNYSSGVQIEALDGGEVSLPLLTQIESGPVQLESDGSGSQLIAPALTTFQGHTGQRYNSSLQETGGGIVDDPDLASINSVNLIGDASGTFPIAASLGLSIAGGTSTVSVGTLLDQGNLGVESTGTLNIQGGLTVSSPGILTTAVGSVVAISGNLLGNTTNADAYSWQGSASFDSGTGTTSPPQLLEAMSADLGGVQAGFVKNFAYGTISLTANTSVELVDQSANTATGKPEAVYANELIVPAGATLDLNNLHLYVRGDQISGAILRGSVTVVASGGSIALDLPTPGTLTPAGATQNWTFYGTAGESITVQLNPGAGGTNPAIAPYLNWGQVSLRNAGGNTLATASSASSGAFATIAGFTLPAGGSYTIQVAAPAAQSTSTGNYVLLAFDVTPNVSLLSINQEFTGTISNPFSVYRYQFTGAAGQQIELQVLGASGGSEFDLTGPGSFTAFTNQQTNSSLITLPSSGPYVLTAHGNGSSGGSYAFKVVQTSVSPLTLGTPLSGQTLTASGQALLYAVTVPSTQSLEITLHDAAPQDVDQLYAKLGSPPTLVDYSASSSTGSANPQLLVPAAAPGTWFILAYGASVPAASSFTIAAIGTPIQLTAAAPRRRPPPPRSR